MHTLIIHNVRTFKAQIHRDELSCLLQIPVVDVVGETVPLDQWSTFYREKINRLVTQ